MKAVVVYESLWGNTARIARAVAEGLGSGAQALSTDEASPDVMKDVDLVVAGAPVLGFSLPTDKMRESIGASPSTTPPDLSHASMRSWLDSVPKGSGRFAAFETRIWWSPGGATKGIERGLARVGYEPLDHAHRFMVTGRYGPLREGETDLARTWGADLAKAMDGVTSETV